MHIYERQAKSTPGWGFWGDHDDIEVGISSGYIPDHIFTADRPHYHKNGRVYVVALEGTGELTVNGKTVSLQAGEVLSIDPGEVYAHIGASRPPFRWITFCTVKDPGDKITVYS